MLSTAFKAFIEEKGKKAIEQNTAIALQVATERVEELGTEKPKKESLLEERKTLALYKEDKVVATKLTEVEAEIAKIPEAKAAITAQDTEIKTQVEEKQKEVAKAAQNKLLAERAGIIELQPEKNGVALGRLGQIERQIAALPEGQKAPEEVKPTPVSALSKLIQDLDVKGRYKQNNPDGKITNEDIWAMDPKQSSELAKELGLTHETKVDPDKLRQAVIAAGIEIDSSGLRSLVITLNNHRPKATDEHWKELAEKSRNEAAEKLPAHDAATQALIDDADKRLEDGRAGAERDRAAMSKASPVAAIDEKILQAAITKLKNAAVTDRFGTAVTSLDVNKDVLDGIGKADGQAGISKEEAAAFMAKAKSSGLQFSKEAENLIKSAIVPNAAGKSTAIEH